MYLTHSADMGGGNSSGSEAQNESSSCCHCCCHCGCSCNGYCILCDYHGSQICICWSLFCFLLDVGIADKADFLPKLEIFPMISLNSSAVCKMIALDLPLLYQKRMLLSLEKTMSSPKLNLIPSPNSNTITRLIAVLCMMAAVMVVAMITGCGTVFCVGLIPFINC